MKTCALIFLLSAFALKASEPARLIAVDPTLFPEALRQHVIECNEDIAAILVGGVPVHATLGVADKKPDGSQRKEEDGTVEKAVMRGDGGTRYYQGDGYRITVMKRWCEIGDVTGFLVGPEVIFEAPLDKNSSGESEPLRISFVRFVAASEVRKKVSNQSSATAPSGRGSP